MSAPLSPGLYLVATPIGSARDITLRALDVLAAADVLAAEDTRTARRLMDIHGLALDGRKVIAYHDHNGPITRPVILAELAAGRSVAYMSEAGSPLIADPGFVLVNEARAAGHMVTAVPGPSSVIAAIMVGGLPSDRFFFAGFPPAQKGARTKLFEELAGLRATLVFFESPKRIVRGLEDMIAVFGPDRRAAVCRELTKKFEEVRQGRLDELGQSLKERPAKGEIVVLVDRPGKAAGSAGMEAALKEALKTMHTREAADHVAAALGLSRRQVYQAALALGREGSG